MRVALAPDERLIVISPAAEIEEHGDPVPSRALAEMPRVSDISVLRVALVAPAVVGGKETGPIVRGGYDVIFITIITAEIESDTHSVDGRSIAGDIIEVN